MIFAAEMGDKTQLVALSLATKYNTRVVLSGIIAATLLIHIFSVILGGVACHLLPQNWIIFLAGLAFIGFGLWTLRGDSLDEDENPKRSYASPFVLVFVTFFLAELGDKTMLGTCALASRYSPIPVWLGSTTGMVLSDGIAIFVGRILGTKLPERPIKIGASAIFFIFGILGVLQGGHELPHIAWVLAAALMGLLTYFLFRAPRKIDSSSMKRDNYSEERIKNR